MCFHNFDLGDDQSMSCVNNILRLLMSPVVLKSSEGRRVLAFFFDQCLELTQDLVEVMKNNIVLGQASTLDAYGARSQQQHDQALISCTFSVCCLRFCSSYL